MSSTTQSAPSWQDGKVAGWIVSVDHKRIGAQYLGWAGVELEHAPVHPRVAIVISQYNRSRDLRRLHNDLRGIGDEVIGVVFCR